MTYVSKRVPQLYPADHIEIRLSGHENGIPTHPADLRGHRCLHYSLAREGQYWHFQVEGAPYRVRIRPVMACNNGRALTEAAIRGMGLVYKPAFLGEPEVEAGRLVRVLDGFSVAPISVHLLYAERDYMPARLRALIDALLDYFGEGQRYD